MNAINPPELGPAKGYSNGVLAGGVLYVAGQVGWNSEHVFAEGFLAQFEQALSNVVAVVRAAGASPERIARMTIYVTDKKLYNASLREIGRIWKDKIGRWWPAMTLVEVKSLLEDKALLELEATAVLAD